MQARPAASRVFERLYRLARQLRHPVPGADAEATLALVRHLYEMARMWRERGLFDQIVNVDEEREGLFIQHVMGAVMRRGTRADTDARHSPVNFIAAVLHTLAQQLCGPEAFAAREAVMAALMARNSCIEGDTAAVDEFSRTWLRLSRPQRWRAAVEMALLGDWVDALGQNAGGDAEIMELLHRHTEREHRCLQPLWERKPGGRRVRMLEDSVAPGVSVRDVITDHRRPEDGPLLGEVEDPRILAVFAHLAPAERAAAIAYSTQRMTWTQAAALSGAADSDAFGKPCAPQTQAAGRAPPPCGVPGRLACAGGRPVNNPGSLGAGAGWRGYACLSIVLWCGSLRFASRSVKCPGSPAKSQLSPLALRLLAFAGVVLPAVWSTHPARRQAAAAVLAQLLAALRGPGRTGPSVPTPPLGATGPAPTGHRQAHPDPHFPDAEARDTTA